MTALGATVGKGCTRFAVRAPRADMVWLCLFAGEHEVRHPMERSGPDWVLTLPEEMAGGRYGYRAAGEWAPPKGLWFDPAKLLVDPYAVELDRRFVQDGTLAEFGSDTANIVPRAIVPAPAEPLMSGPPHFAPGGLIYELNVRGFTRLHPDVPEHMRGTVAALAHPSVIAHLRKLHVSAVELMPVVAWIDERHLPPLGLVNAWGYNPVAMMALDPGLCPGGIAELRETVAALHAEGIGVLLDLVFNHSGESDVAGGVISLRGLDNGAYAHAPDGSLINDTGCGNMLDFANPAVRRLALDAMRHFVTRCGVDGFRFDLAPVLARGPGFDPAAPIFAEIAADPVLSTRVMIAEPWDIGPGGYQLGNFPASWLEWNDRFRDDVRRFWKAEEGIGKLATRLAGSSDVFGPVTPDEACRSINFLAAHDGFTLADTVSYENRHNWANGEQNRDGHGDNFSWNNGVEGSSDDPQVLAARHADIKAMLGTLFVSTGTIMLTAGDEFGRTQHGNNNAYCQDNAIGWIDWERRDCELEDHVAELAAFRAANRTEFARQAEDLRWVTSNGEDMTVADWESPFAETLCWQLGGGALKVSVRREAREVLLGQEVTPAR
ncbi:MULTISPECIES: glycogen debranching protein GlgX [unclassified Novosphingobium]|uniref:glycogen debranching protein GlgX n=1 Tax=unclassified Novosphingobium TaxID=2644732 RepID=UPI0012C32EA4|nr:MULTISPECIES: glycogen debranching protein GlgX [unclassified Novosphingobium]MPS68632.1 glycogen debranching protein GlgX [Novosphingobium sp.]WRT93962.1 glycogen debranching protein GlgX [Novosphingobium sp. RL4]